MQVSTVLNTLPPSWDSAVTSLNCLGQVLIVDTLAPILALEQERMNHHQSVSNLMMIEDSSNPSKLFKNQRKKREKYER